MIFATIKEFTKDEKLAENIQFEELPRVDDNITLDNIEYTVLYTSWRIDFKRNSKAYPVIIVAKIGD